MIRGQCFRAFLTNHSPRSCTVSTRHLSSTHERCDRRRVLDIDTLVSVLEVSATRRDAKGYLQTYASSRPRALVESPQFEQGEASRPDGQPVNGQNLSHHVAIVKLRNPHRLDRNTLLGVARTLHQLRALGLLSIVVLDCGGTADRDLVQEQALNLCEDIDFFSKPGSKLLQSLAVASAPRNHDRPNLVSHDYQIEDNGQLQRAINRGSISVVPALVQQGTAMAPKGADADQVILALTRYISGMQFDDVSAGGDTTACDQSERPRKIATVERIIILDPLGGTPDPRFSGTPLRFVNLEQEFQNLVHNLGVPTSADYDTRPGSQSSAVIHSLNLKLARDALSMLPPSSSALITSPYDAANLARDSPLNHGAANNGGSSFRFEGMVTTRKRKNPLLHNLLTDKPVYSSSLPCHRLTGEADGEVYSGQNAAMPAASTTLVKRGMPVTIYPNPHTTPWTSASSSGSRLKLTDHCIDLPRLVYLIEDSFGRKLDVQDYLARVENKLAGIIIAGEYEGGAILTWELPEGQARQDHKEEQEVGRMVPYLDKFAVLRSRQGSGGVADIVFNAMVGECFPQGVCWRSRKDNPVNKWYFERSAGTRKLPGTNWSMFWTTPGLENNSPTLRDYENICRQVEPSWLDGATL